MTPPKPSARLPAASHTGCRHWISAEARYCDEVDGVRLYLSGRRCPTHTPAALAGNPEPGESPT